MNNKNIPTEVIHKEIDLIQSCITRMAHNSFLLKGWLVSLIAVIIALLPKDINIKLLCFLVTGITLCFWYLDGYFLKLERLYRKKYEWVISERLNGNSNYLYDLNPYNKNMWLKSTKEKPTIVNSIFSSTLIPFYGITISIILIICNKF